MRSAYVTIRRCAGSSAERQRRVAQPRRARWVASKRDGSQRPENLRALAELSGAWIDRVRTSRSTDEIVLDMDSSVSPTHGEQEQSVWNGHFGCTCYHPLFVFNQYGDLERCALRPGKVHSADGWEQVLKPVVARYRGTVGHIAFRGDAAFAQPNMYEFLEAEGIDYAIRLPANQVLQEGISDLLRRPVGRPAHYVQRFDRSFRYQAVSWAHPYMENPGLILTMLRKSSRTGVKRALVCKALSCCAA